MNRKSRRPPLQSTSRRMLAILGLQVAPEHAEGQRVAEAHAVARGDLLVDRDQGRAGIVGGPPVAGHELGAVRHGLGIGEAPVAADRPRDIVRDLDLGDGPTGDPNDPGPQAGQELLQAAARHLGQDLAQDLALLRLDVDQVERRCAGRQAQLHLVVEVAGEDRHRRQQRDARSQGHDHARRRRARPMQVRDREAQGEAAAMLQTAGREQQQAGEAPEQECGHGHGEHEPGADRRLRDAQDRHSGQRQHGHAHHHQIARARPAARRRDQRPKQACRRHLAR